MRITNECPINYFEGQLTADNTVLMQVELNSSHISYRLWPEESLRQSTEDPFTRKQFQVCSLSQLKPHQFSLLIEEQDAEGAVKLKSPLIVKKKSLEARALQGLPWSNPELFFRDRLAASPVLVEVPDSQTLPEDSLSYRARCAWMVYFFFERMPTMNTFLSQHSEVRNYYRNFISLFVPNFSDPNSFSNKISNLADLRWNNIFLDLFSTVLIMLCFMPFFTLFSMLESYLHLIFFALITPFALLTVLALVIHTLSIFDLLNLSTHLSILSFPLNGFFILVLGVFLAPVAAALGVFIGAPFQALCKVLFELVRCPHRIIRNFNASHVNAAYTSHPVEHTLNASAVQQAVLQYNKGSSGFCGLFRSRSNSSKHLLESLSLANADTVELATRYLNEPKNVGKRLWTCLKMAALSEPQLNIPTAPSIHFSA